MLLHAALAAATSEAATSQHRLRQPVDSLKAILTAAFPTTEVEMWLSNNRLMVDQAVRSPDQLLVTADSSDGWNIECSDNEAVGSLSVFARISSWR